MNDSSDFGKHGRLFFNLCRKIFRKFGPNREKLKRTLTLKEEKFNALENEFRLQERMFEAQKFRLSARARDVAFKEFNKIETKFKRLEKSHKQEELKKALRFLGAKVEPYEIGFFAGFVTFVTFIIGFFLMILLFVFSLDKSIVLLVIPIVFILPIFIYSIAVAYPKILAKRIKISTLAKTPEVINYMAMSMRVSPSLDRAVEFAADNTDEPMASELKKILWDIYMRKHNRIEDAFLSFAHDWSDIDDFKRSLYAIRSSPLERTEAGFNRSLDKANEIALSGTKRRIEGFVSTLSAPTTVLFSLGIILPLIIGAMLPMLSLGSMDLDMGIESSGMSVQDSNPLGIILFMDVIFPLAGVLYAYHILGKRPGTSLPPDIGSKMSKGSRKNLGIISVVCGFVLIASGVWIVFFTQNIVGTFLILWGLGLPVALYYFITTRNQKTKRTEIVKMEEELPDALFQLGSRITEGNPVEYALKTTSETMKGSKIGGLFEKISFHVQITRTTLEDALFGSNGILNEFPSKTIKAAMKVVVEVTRKDALAAGQTIISISNYLRDMKKIEHDIKTSLKSSVDSMKATGMIFAPLVMGVTAGLYFLLSGVFEGFGSGAQMIPPYLFLLIIGIYLLLTVVIIIYFCTGIEHGVDTIERKYQTAFGIPVSLLVFTVATFFAHITLLP